MLRTRSPRRRPTHAGEAGEGSTKAALGVGPGGGGLTHQSQQAGGERVVAAGPLQFGADPGVVLRALEPGDHLRRPGERGKGGRDALVAAGPPLLGGLELLPVRRDLVGVAGPGRLVGGPNTCGCRRTSFATIPAATSSMPNGRSGSSSAIRAWNTTCSSRSPSSSRRWSRSLGGLDRLEHLVGLLEQVRQQRGVRLAGVPRAPARATGRRSITATRSSRRAPGTSCEAVRSSTSGGAPSMARRERISASASVRPGSPSGEPNQATAAPPRPPRRQALAAAAGSLTADEPGPDAGRAERLEPVVVEFGRRTRRPRRAGSPRPARRAAPGRPAGWSGGGRRAPGRPLRRPPGHRPQSAGGR